MNMFARYPDPVRGRDVERLEAISFNCVRHGPGAQNRDGHADFRAHPRGKVAHIASVDASRAAWLRELFERVDWSATS